MVLKLLLSCLTAVKTRKTTTQGGRTRIPRYGSKNTAPLCSEEICTMRLPHSETESSLWRELRFRRPPTMCACSRAKGGGSERKKGATEPAAVMARSRVLLALLLALGCSPLPVAPFLTQHQHWRGGSLTARRTTGASTPTSYHRRSPRERSVVKRRRTTAAVAAAAAAAVVETAADVGSPEKTPGVIACIPVSLSLCPSLSLSLCLSLGLTDICEA